MKRKTHEDFIKEVYDLVGNEYIVLGKYTNSQTKILIKHTKCNHEYMVIPNSFLRGRRCPNCFGKLKRTTSQFKKEVYDLVEGEYIVLGEYINANTKILMKHSKCGHSYMVTPSSFTNNNSRCPKCFGTEQKTTSQFKEEVYRLVGNEYIVLGKYINANTKILMKHNKCGHEYMVTPSKFRDNKRCPKCAGNQKKTTLQFKKEMYDLVGNEYSVLGEYVGANTKILMKHNKCGHEYMMTPSSFISKKTRCPKCFGGIKKTTKQFKEEVHDLVGNEYDVLSEYVGANTKILMKHNKCGHSYMVTPSSFTNNNSRCPKCFGTEQKTTSQFKEEVYRLVGNEYIVLGKYVNANTKILMKHNQCGYEYKVLPNNFTKFNGTRCPKCFGTEQKTTKQFKEEVYNLVGDEYSVLGEYINSQTKILINHNKCNHGYMVVPNSFLRGSRCPKCFGVERKTTEQFKEEVYNLVGGEYTVLSEYINNHIKILMKHSKCGHEYMVAPSSFIHGNSRCPKCRSSKGELKILSILDRYNVDYKIQYKFKECKYKLSLPFDFAIFYKGNLVLLIEYDGIQHFKPIDRFGGMDSLEVTQLRDSIKTQYCRENNIPLLRIPYWEFDNINKIILKKLFRLGLI